MATLKLPPPPVPQRLREMLRDYPEHIERLQEVLDPFATPKTRLMPFDEAIWALEGRLETFIHEARDELEAAEASGDAEAIKKAKEKELLMFQARPKGRWLGDVAFSEYFRTYEKAFE